MLAILSFVLGLLAHVCVQYVVAILPACQVRVNHMGVGFVGVYVGYRDACASQLCLYMELLGHWFQWALLSWRTSLHLRRRKLRLARNLSKRVGSVLRNLDYDGDSDVEELIQDCHYVRAAVVYSRKCRMALRYPKHSAANEAIVVDWMMKNFAKDTPFSVRYRILPLAVKLTFVKSGREITADSCFKLLESMVEKA